MKLAPAATQERTGNQSDDDNQRHPDHRREHITKPGVLEERRSVARKGSRPQRRQAFEASRGLRWRRLPRRCIRDLLSGFGMQEIIRRPFAPRRTGRDDAQRRENRQDGERDP